MLELKLKFGFHDDVTITETGTKGYIAGINIGKYGLEYSVAIISHDGVQSYLNCRECDLEVYKPKSKLKFGHGK